MTPLSQQLQIIKDEMERTRIQRQLECEHEHIIEAPYSPGKYLDSLPNFRVCRDCGFAENGWNCGFQVLERVDEKMSRDEAHNFKVGPLHPNRRFVRDGDIRDKRLLYKRAVRREPEIG